MKAIDTKLISFFQHSCFEIPDYQRGYDWKTSNFDSLWEDVLYYLDDESNLFLGNIIIQTEDGDLNSESINYVVDGQQRITTLTILFCAIRSALFNRIDEAEDNLKGRKEDQIDRNYLYLHNLTEVPIKPKLLAAQSIRNALMYMCSKDWIKNQEFPDEITIDEKILNVEEEFKEIKPVYNFFISKLEEKNKSDNSYVFNLEKIYKILQVISNAQLIEMVVNDEKEAFYLFEIVNARGLDLQVGDLLKNHIFSQLDRNTANELWEEIRENTGKKSSSLTRALRYFYFSEGGYISSKELYSKLKKLVKLENNINTVDDLLVEIHDYSEFLKKGIEGTKEEFVDYFKLNLGGRGKLSDFQNQKLMYESISALNTFNFTQTQPLIYSFFKNFNRLTINNRENYDYLSKYPQIFLTALENFHFINYCIGENRANRVETDYANYCYKFNYAATTEKFKDLLMSFLSFLREEKDGKEIFCEMFEKNAIFSTSTRNKRIIHYIYHKFNLGHNKNNLQIWDPPTYKSGFSVEHWASRGEVGDSAYEEIRKGIDPKDLNKFGNLLSIDSTQNSSLQDGSGNFSPTEKSQWFEESRGENYKFQNQFLDDFNSKFDTWSSEDIIERTHKIAIYGYQNIWTIPTI